MNVKNLRFLILILLGVTGTFHTHAQSMVIETKSGTDTVSIVDTLEKFSFSNENLLVDLVGGSIKTYSLTEVQKIFFISDGSTPVTTGVQETVSGTGQNISVYPNPAENILYLQNLPDGVSAVIIYNMEGIPVLSMQVSGDNKSIGISNLTKGLYLIRINNQALKFIKL
jgi:hypothetical protein